MGTWGTKLYENDLALDVQEDYRRKFLSGMSNEQIIQEIIKEYDEFTSNIIEGSIFWISLADTMWDFGNLTDEIKEKALFEISKMIHLEIWENNQDNEEYKQELNKLSEKLNLPMPEAKHIKSEKQLENNWKIGDIYAYYLNGETFQNEELNKQYLILRKVQENEESNRTNVIVYWQITTNHKLPNSLEEIEKLPYIIQFNEGNVRYQYKTKIHGITKKILKERLIYIGNFKYNACLKDEYNETINLCFFKEIDEAVLFHYKTFGTSANPVYIEQNPEDILDSQIRFLMREKYYEKILEIQPQKDSYIADDPILYISLIDSMMIKGFVKNPVGPLTQKMKNKSYKKIELLRSYILEKEQDKESQDYKLKILEELEEKIQKY